MKTGNIPAIIAEGRRVLKQEASALEALAESLDENFAEAVKLLMNIKGRVAVTGMGKSGHVARKVAATLASTGTPAYFIHPAEAGHGDLGMITPEDAVVAYSNSGATEELTAVLSYCARNLVPVIGVTQNEASPLAKQSELTLILPKEEEACPINSAPTTSTTMMMALGDALALCLLTAKGFSVEDFHRYHPKGSLGQRLEAVRTLMHKGEDLPIVTTSTSIPEVLLVMTAKRLGCTCVVDEDGSLVGVITDGDLRRHLQNGLLNLRAEEIMTPNPVTISPDTLAQAAVGLMQKKSITTVLVKEAGELVGILHIHDLLKAGLK